MALSRAEAMSTGATQYFSGKPCPKGHVAARTVPGSHCLACKREDDRRRGQTEQEKLRKREWQLANPEKAKAAQKRAVLSRLEYYRTCRAQWTRDNPEKQRAKRARRRAAQMNRTPVWADHEKIEQFYTDAQSMAEWLGEPVHVDHIIPLQGKYVSGLHVHENLQLLPSIENWQKANHYFDAETLCQKDIVTA